MMIPAIPTTYAGVNFRSRLEARWAAFFDVIGWRWEYEPMDLAGYIPDFILPFAYGDLLVEVKPDREPHQLRAHVAKVLASGWKKDFLIVGESPFFYEASEDGRVERDFPLLGLLSQDDEGNPLVSEGLAYRCADCASVSVLHSDNRWVCVVCGAYDGKRLVHLLEPGFLAGCWRTAGNRVQWAAKAMQATTGAECF
jgi:hypothetical protein